MRELNEADQSKIYRNSKKSIKDALHPKYGQIARHYLYINKYAFSINNLETIIHH